MPNPFQFRELPIDAPFCNRREELEELVSHARNNTNVVVVSPRRFGKTSLVKRVQSRIRDIGGITVYTDFFGVTSIEDVASRMAANLYEFCKRDESLMKKATRLLSIWRLVLRPEPEYGVSVGVEPTATRKGEELLEETLAGFGRFIADIDHPFNVVIDEIQEITELRDSLKIEGTMRKHIQTHTKASYFFIGSRRRLLSDMFTQRKRPFYQSAVYKKLKELPIEETENFIIERFKAGGKRCSREIARRISEKTRCYPYYIQRIPYSIFEVAGRTVTEEDYLKGFSRAIDEERIVFESMLSSLAPKQIKLLIALAGQATAQPYSAEYITSFRLSSLGGMQAAMKRLISLDYVEKTDDGVYQVVDPVFAIWLRHLK